MIEKDAEEENVYEETKQNIAYAHNTHTYTYRQLVRGTKMKRTRRSGRLFRPGWAHTHIHTQ